MASKGLLRLLNPFINWFGKYHNEALGRELRKYGLRYDDCLDPLRDMDVAEALRRLPQEVVDARNQRLKRALDLSLKHQVLPKDIQEKQTPFEFYLQDMLELVKMENAERASLGTGKPYERQIP